MKKNKYSLEQVTSWIYKAIKQAETQEDGIMSVPSKYTLNYQEERTYYILYLKGIEDYSVRIELENGKVSVEVLQESLVKDMYLSQDVWDNIVLKIEEVRQNLIDKIIKEIDEKP